MMLSEWDFYPSMPGGTHVPSLLLPGVPLVWSRNLLKQCVDFLEMVMTTEFDWWISIGINSSLRL